MTQHLMQVSNVPAYLMQAMQQAVQAEAEHRPFSRRSRPGKFAGCVRVLG